MGERILLAPTMTYPEYYPTWVRISQKVFYVNKIHFLLLVELAESSLGFIESASNSLSWMRSAWVSTFQA
jgi:hypothetical protein